MDWLLYVVAALFALLGAGCLFLVAIQLPGGWVMLGLALLVEWCDRFYLPPDDRQTFRWWVLGASLVLLVLGEIVEFAASMLGAKRAGSSRRGAWGALIGGVLGAFVLTPVFFFVPLLGALLGAILGTFLGAIIGELTAPRASVAGSLRPAFGAAVGRVVATAGKLALTMAAWAALSVAAFLP